MQAMSSHTGVAAPLRRSNVDTDQIIPAVYLKRITRSGFDDALFAQWRQDPDFVLNQQPYVSASILLAGSDFGTGSSREHAVWALWDYGFRVVLAPRFGDIFRGNSAKQGLVAGVVAQEVIDQLWDYVDAHPGAELTVDLTTTTVTAGEMSAAFEIDEYARWRIMQGLDDIALTLQHQGEIADFEAGRPRWLPTTASGNDDYMSHSTVRYGL